MLSIVHRSVLGSAACLVLLCGGVRAADLHVPGDHPDIQSAIDAAQFGDVIHVGPGTWQGPLVVIGKSITIEGAGADVTVLHGLGAERTLYVTSLPGGSADVALRNATVTGGFDGAKADLPGTLRLYNCVVRDNAGVGAVGLDFAVDTAFLDNGSHGLSDFNLAVGCTFQGNGGWGAIDLDGKQGEPGLGSDINRCQFLGNSLGGLRLFASSTSAADPAVVGLWYSTFRNDRAQISMLKFDGTGLIAVRRCSFQNSTLKVMHGNLDMDTTIMRGPAPIEFLIGQPDTKVTYSDVEGGWALPLHVSNIDADPLWAAPEAGDFSLLPGSPCINTGSSVLASDPDFSPSEMGAVTYDAWTDLGGGVAGSAASVELLGTGSLIPGKEVRLSLISGLPGSAALLVIGTDALGAPFKGGVLWPHPDIIIGPYQVPFGSLLVLLKGDWPAGLPSGFSFWSQVWWTDAAAEQGLAATHGLRATQP